LKRAILHDGWEASVGISNAGLQLGVFRRCSLPRSSSSGNTAWLHSVFVDCLKDLA